MTDQETSSKDELISLAEAAKENGKWANDK
jgi:hypothetical protein